VTQNMFLEILLVAMAFLAVMLVAGNNLSACVGPAVGARILNRKTGALIGAVGYSAGLLIQGSGMTQSVGVLLPNATLQLQAEALTVAIIIFLAAALLRVPMSVNMSLVGLLAGSSIAHNSTASLPFVGKIVLMWFIAPVAAAALAFSFIRAINTSEAKNIWRRIRTYKILLLVLSFTTAYVLGANTLGLIVAVSGFSLATLAAAVAAIFVGSFFLSEGAIRRVSQEFYLMRYSNATATLVASTVLVELATFFNIPLSNTQTTAAAVFGAGISYKTKFISLKPYLTIAAGWVVAPLLSFAVGLLL
jgi:inorganic phosphate transporter, PiT family